MASQAIECNRAGAEIFTGDATCRKKSMELLEEFGIPKGLLPLEDIQELGYNRDSGFIWLVQTKKVDHTFTKVKKTVSCDPKVMAFIEKGQLRKITGVKVKGLMFWVSMVEMHIPEASPDKVSFKSSSGLSKTLDAAAFAIGE